MSMPLSSPQLESTREALTILQSLKTKRKNENPSFIQATVRQIYNLFWEREMKMAQNSSLRTKVEDVHTRSQIYLYQCQEKKNNIEDMLQFIREKTEILLAFRNESELSTSRSCTSEDENPEKKEKQKDLAKTLQSKQEQINQMRMEMNELEVRSKTMQMKLMSNIRMLSTQLKQKQNYCSKIERTLSEKQEQFIQMQILNQKKQKKIRDLQQSLIQVELELQNKEEELEIEKKCSEILEKKVKKICLQIPQQSMTNQTLDHNICQIVKEQKIAKLEQVAREVKQFAQICIQTEDLNEDDELHSLDESVLTESKESKYIESIQRLTTQLGEAYNKINQLMNAEEQTVARPMSRSGYFGSFFK